VKEIFSILEKKQRRYLVSPILKRRKELEGPDILVPVHQ
jgi:hypothetical protein